MKRLSIPGRFDMVGATQESRTSPFPSSPTSKRPFEDPNQIAPRTFGSTPTQTQRSILGSVPRQTRSMPPKRLRPSTD